MQEFEEIVLSPTDLALVNLDDLIRTTDLLTAALQDLEHAFPAQNTPVSNRMVRGEVRFRFGRHSRGAGCRT